jgi:hypothetical protein
MVPNGIAYETGANPAILDAELFHCRKQRHDMRLSLKELDYPVAGLHVGQTNQLPTHPGVRIGSTRERFPAVHIGSGLPSCPGWQRADFGPPCARKGPMHCSNHRLDYSMTSSARGAPNWRLCNLVLFHVPKHG